ncbi:LacI family transcriptional regulator [Streptomyces paludis]|uniref:LacI family transcriptional regulator n=2 Tax=Streptomyces paludis TaxID=2282738 RepID=A0A345I251_9ACTN|nr:LacI family transcriptional regulator [Streptomyces paludis]
MADVAERAGVSVSTVSRTLRGLPSVSADTRDRVERAAHELSFAISRSASSLVTGRTGRIAVLGPRLESWFLGAVLAGVHTVLRETGYDLLVYSVTDLAERRAFFDRLPARRNADALLVTSFDLTPEEHAGLDALGMPVVLVSQYAPDRPSVYVDDAAGARQGVRHLVNLGHRRIAFVQPRDDTGFSWSSRARLTGYRQALEAAGIPYDDALVRRPAQHVRRELSGTIGAFMSLPEPPTAIFADSDEVAVQLISALRAAHLDVPGDMSVMGFDDHQLAEWLDLSTVAQPAREIGGAAARLACAIIESATGDERTRHVEFPTSVVARGSTAPYRPSAQTCPEAP